MFLSLPSFLSSFLFFFLAFCSLLLLDLHPCTTPRHLISSPDMLKNISEMSEENVTESGHEKSDSFQGLSLDQLFAELAKETKPVHTEDTDEFAKIQKQIQSLPQIESKLETHMEQAVQEKKVDVVKINDPISHAKTALDKTAPTDSGSQWFNMKKPEMTPELKRDLLILKNRSALDPKRHYKKEKWQVPQYFQSGTIIEGNTEYYSRLSRKSRGKTLAEEILHDDDSSKYFKRKYYEIQKERTSGGKRHYNKIKQKRRGY